MNEMGFSVEEYLLLSNKTIERAILPNKAKNKKVTLLTKPKKYANENPQTLTDGAFGGNSFYSDWLGFEGKNFEAIIDLGVVNEISNISTAFLQVTNHIVFFPEQVDYFSSSDGITFKPMGSVPNAKPLFKKSTINDIEYFDLKLDKVKTRYVKVVAKNMGTAPIWHNAAGLPVWIFTDEIIIN
jgi:hypothetical protein